MFNPVDHLPTTHHLWPHLPRPRALLTPPTRAIQGEFPIKSPRFSKYKLICIIYRAFPHKCAALVLLHLPDHHGRNMHLLYHRTTVSTSLSHILLCCYCLCSSFLQYYWTIAANKVHFFKFFLKAPIISLNKGFYYDPTKLGNVFSPVALNVLLIKANIMKR